MVLASSSPRRIELLKQFGIKFDIVPSNVDEIIDPDLPPEKNAMNLAKKKAEEVFRRLGESAKDSLIISADTIVFIEGTILGKPSNEEEAFYMLKR